MENEPMRKTTHVIHTGNANKSTINKKKGTTAAADQQQQRWPEFSQQDGSTVSYEHTLLYGHTRVEKFKNEKENQLPV